MPAAVTDRNWPKAEEAERLEALVHQALRNSLPAIRHRLAADEALRLSSAFLEESRVPQPQLLHGILCSLPPGVAGQSIGARFVGRADLLRNIHRTLSEGSGKAARLTGRITAGGGFGKTRLAIEYLYRFASYYPGGIFWVNAESSAIEAEFWRILSAINPRVPDLAVMRGQGRDVRRELERALRKIEKPALYVIDNIPEPRLVTDPQPIGDFCPALGAVAILATSRQDTREENVRTIPVDVLNRDSAILLLTDNLPGAATLSWADWGQIAEWVGDLPFALDLLNASLALGSISPQAALERVHLTDPEPGAAGELDRLREGLRGQVPPNAIRGVTDVFSISFVKLDPASRQVAQLLAQLAPAPIPEAFMEALPEELKTPGVRAALRSRHFVTAGDHLSFGIMHRLMVGFLRRAAPALAPKLLEAACAVLRRVMTPEHCRDTRHWPVMKLCRPHAETLFARCSATDVASAVVPPSTMGLMAASLALAQGDHAGARRIQERVLEVRRRVLGDEHPDTLEAMNNLAGTLGAQGDYAGARHLQEKVLEVRRRVLGGEHPHTLTSMNNLAGTLQLQGDWAVAGQLHEKVLEVSRRVLGEEDPHTLTSMGNLATALGAQGNHAGARDLQQQVVEGMARVLGEDHMDTLGAMNNLAATLDEQGDFKGARHLHERVLKGLTSALGEEHPGTLSSMGNLALTLMAQGHYTRARRLQEQVLEARTRMLGPEHPHTLSSMDNLAATLSAQGDNARARQLQEKVLVVAKRVLGEDHPSTLNSMNNLAATLAPRNRAEAIGLLRTCLSARRKVLGENHPKTISTAAFLKRLEKKG